MSHKKSSDLRRLHNRVGVQESESGIVNPAFQDDESSREAGPSNSKEGSENKPSSSQQQGAKASGSRGESFFPKEDSLDKFVKKILRRSNSEGDISLSGSSRRGDFSSESSSEKETSFVSTRGGGNQELNSESGTAHGKPERSTENGSGDGASSSSANVNDDLEKERENGEVDNPAPEDPPAPIPPEVPVNQDEQILPVGNDNNDAIIVQIEEEEEEIDNQEPAEPVGPLEQYLNFINSIGLSLYRREDYVPLSIRRSMVIKIIFWTFCWYAIVQTLRGVKIEGLEVAHKGDLKGCVKFGFHIIRSLKRAFFVHLMTICAEKVSLMLNHIRIVLHAHYGSSPASRLAILMGLGSILLTTITVIFSYSHLNNWSFEDAILTRAYHMGKSIFLWSYNDFGESKGALFYRFYESGITATNLALGIMDALFQFCEILQGEIIRDIHFLVADTLLSGWRLFEQRIQPQLDAHPNNTDPAELEACLRQYKEMRQTNSVINKTLALMHRLLIIHNLFLYTYLFTLMMTDGDKDFRIIHTAIQIIKAGITFYKSWQIHGTNENVKKWLRLLSTYNGPVDVEGILGMTVELALDELKDDPIAFGTEYFLINETFIMGFGAAVASIVSFLVESNN